MQLELKNLLNNGSLTITNTTNTGRLLIYTVLKNGLMQEDNILLADEDGNYLTIDVGV